MDSGLITGARDETVDVTHAKTNLSDATRSCPMGWIDVLTTAAALVDLEAGRLGA